MRYPNVSKEEAKTYIEKKRSGEKGARIEIDYSGEQGSQDIYTDFEPELLSLVEAALNRGLANPKIDKDQVEGELALRIFATLDGLPAVALTDANFWRYLSCGPFFDFIAWRDGANCGLQSYGASSAQVTADCVPYRMFLRVLVVTVDLKQITGAENAMIEGLVTQGKRTDVWRSHILRVRNAYAPKLVRQIFAAHSDGELPTSVVREVAKIIKRKRANLIIEILDQEETTEVLNAAIKLANQNPETL